MTNDMHDKQRSFQFYEKRYAEGYMESWPAEKIQQITDVIRSLSLPNKGEVLDLGAGMAS